MPNEKLSEICKSNIISSHDNSDSDSLSSGASVHSNDDVSLNDVMKCITKSLFRKKNDYVLPQIMGGRGENGACDNVTPMDTKICKFAVTINPDPFYFMKRADRPYKSATHKEQQGFIKYAIASLERDNPSVSHTTIMYEVCPKLKQIHAHCIVEMPLIYVSTYVNYMKRVICRHNSPSWRHTEVEQIYNRQGWINYITKDQEC